MKLINAGIKSKKEAAQRLIDGEVFYSKGGQKIYFCEANTPPFYFDDQPLKGMWYDFMEWQIEDPYAELKEACAAGKTVQIKGLMNNWVDDHIPTWKLPPERYLVKPEPKTVKMWQWIIQLKPSANRGPFLTEGFYANTPNFANVDWIRKAEWTEIEVEVTDG